MKKLLVLLFTSALFLLAGCSSDIDETSLDPKHEALPDFVENAKAEVKEAYIMASNYPEVLASVPCYCGCYAQDGHISNLDCFVDGMGSDKNVTGWDTMGVS
jgi:protein involved in sex pheromone biosynthesis